MGLILLMDSQSINAQYFKAIKADAEYCFRDTIYNEIQTYKIDTTIYLNGDVYYYNFKQIRPTSTPYCYTPDGSSWLGDPVIEKPDGTFLFRNVDYNSGELTDTIFIKTQATLNQKWHLYNYPGNSDYLEAEVTSIQNETCIGIFESVKTFTLTRKNSTGSVVPDYINGQEIKLSKHFGLTRLPKFDFFPATPRFYEIIGKTNPVSGLVNPGIHEIYDFEPGDEYHTYELRYYYNYDYSEESWQIKRVLEKLVSSDDEWVCYKSDICLLNRYGHAGDYTYSNYHSIHIDTIYFNSELANGLSKQPSESIVTLPSSYYTMSFEYDGFIKYGKFAKYLNQANELYLPQANGCWKSYNIEFPCEPIYIQGLGGPYYDCPSMFYDASFLELVYYKKGNETWGNPLSCDSLLTVGLKDLTRSHSLTVSPNPTNGIISVTVPEGKQSGRFELFDLSGRMVAGFNQKQEIEQFDISSLPAGVYFCKFRSDKGEVYQAKIIRQ